MLDFVKDLLAVLVILAPELFSFLKVCVPHITFLSTFVSFQKNSDGSYTFVFRLYHAAPNSSSDPDNNKPPDGFYDLPGTNDNNASNESSENSSD